MICQRRCVALGVPPLKGGWNPTHLTQTLRTTLRRLNAVPMKQLRKPYANLTHEMMLNPTQNPNNPTQPYADAVEPLFMRVSNEVARLNQTLGDTMGGVYPRVRGGISKS